MKLDEVDFRRQSHLSPGQTLVFDEPSDIRSRMYTFSFCDRVPFIMASNIPPSYFAPQTKKLRGDGAGLSQVSAPLVSVLYNKYMGGVDTADKLRA